ncbi:hypothetical protein DWV29_26985 [Enterocloster asparagiformis]|uniref:SLH domain-containing protein n=1 Tax=Enterocloster asparagiformis TaxID=333367 RepID=A0A413F712_9FIRM|nr:leucine-rich repeat protein [Enterocloster asparagiformis]RGX21034.1 hypothetical protein DWV29_26985 [Enterocloster asparagiformis]
MLRTRKRIGAALLAAGLVFSQLGATAYAVESPAGTGLCEHHTAHDAAVCGYVEAIPGRDCEHEHTPECYTDELICGMDEDAEQTATDSDAGHTHGQACYALDCSHERGEHTTDCGYIEAVPGTPCGYVCEVCAGEPDKDSGKEEPTISGNGLTAPEKTGTETGEPGDTGTITVTAFDGIPDAVKQQTVPAGTTLDGLTLPATLGASGYVVSDDTDPEPEAITITGVTWEPDSPWDDTAEQGGYLFTPVLPAGYTLADGVELPEIDVLIGGAVTLALQGGVLTVTFDRNGTGGTDEDNNEMKTAIETALSGDDKADVATIKLTGSAAEVTGYNWQYLIDLYNESSGWNSLTALDLSGMTNLTTVKNDTGMVKSQQTKLQTLTLPDSVTQIGDSAFNNCKNLKLTELPGGVTQIGDFAFRGCTGITLTELPDGVTQIGNSAFSSCTGITLTELPGGLEQIKPSAFRGCTGITLTELPGGLEQIEPSAFYGCMGITLTELPDGVTQIGGSAFAHCTGITLTELPGGVEQIGDFAFYGCTGLDKIIMEPTTAPTINDSTFENTSTGLTFYVPKGGTGYDSGGWENLNTVEYSPVTSISLPATLELRPNGSGTLTTTFIPSDATFKEVIWESSDTNIVAVDQDGNVTAVSNGTATITATSRQGRKTATCTVTVKDAPPVTIPVIGVTLNHSAYTLHTDKDPRSFQLIATVEPSNASNKAVSWQSSDTGIATVDASGNVTAVKEGTATITVATTDGSKTATCTVTVKTDSSGGGGNSGGGSSHYITTTPEPPKPNHPVLAVIELPVSVGNGTATGKPDDGRTAAAIAEAGKDAKAKTNGIAVQYDAKTSLTYDGFSIVIQRATLDRLIAAKVQYVILNTGVVDITFDLAALQEIQKQATGDITLTAVRETGLAGDALAAVGSRPAYRLTVNYTGADGKAATVQSFGAGRVTVGLAYKPAATEQTGGLYLVYSADGKGAEWLYQSSYDRNSGNVIGSVGHFSVYAVGHRPAPAFTDTVNHWAKADIDFVVSRGLLAGTDDATFTPDGTTTRGMFVVALGRLAGIDPAAYPSSRFNDVATTAYYAPYVEWAASKGIVSGTGDKTFSPDATITREQMAAIMQRYADKLGYTLPVAREAEIFADEGQITSGMKKAVQAIQQAGIMSGKGNNRFGPKDTATRAEAATVLRRFVEIVIDPAAGGWGQNDAGKWLYYENNKPMTGWKQIDGTWYYFDAAGLMQAGGWQEISGKWYYFYPDGAMAANTKIDGYEIDPDGARKE